MMQAASTALLTALFQPLIRDVCRLRLSAVFGRLPNMPFVGILLPRSTPANYLPHRLALNAIAFQRLRANRHLIVNGIGIGIMPSTS